MIKIKKYLFSIVLILSSTYAVYGETVPIDKYGTLEMEFVISPDIMSMGKCDLWSDCWSYIPEQYIQRFGAYPDMMFWDDLEDPVQTVIEIYFKRKSNPNPHFWPPVPDYPLDMTWGDIRKFFYWKLESYKTGEVKYFPLEQGADATQIVGKNMPHSWRIVLRYDGKKIPVPNDNSAWKVSLDMYEEDPNSGNVKPLGKTQELDIIRTTRTTPLDTLQWAMHANVFDENPELNWQLLRSFPNDRSILDNLMNYHLKEKNPDSLEYYGRRYLQVFRDRSDPIFVRYYMDNDSASAPRPIANEDYDYVQMLYRELTGDTLDLGERNIPPEEAPYNSLYIE